MNWTEQVESMIKMWNDTQKQFLGGWQNLAGDASMSSLPGISAMPNLPNPMSWFMPGLSSAFGKTGSAGQSTVENLFSSQTMMMQTLGMLAQAWKAVAPSISAGKPWQPSFDEFLKQWRDEVFGAPQRFSTAGMNAGELVKSFMGEWGPLLKPWLASVQGTGLIGPLGNMLMGEKNPFSKMFTTEPAFQDLAQIPIVGVGREQLAKITRAFDAHVDVRNAGYKYQSAIAKTIGEAMRETVEHLVKLAEKGEQVNSVRDLIRIWVRIADRKFTEMYVSDEFLAIQRDVSRANLKNKLAQRAVLEIIFKQLEIPTRTELDDAYKTLHGLKREMRELRMDSSDVRDNNRQAEAHMMELRNVRKQAETEATQLRNTADRLESEVASLRNALQKMENKFADFVKQSEGGASSSKAAPASTQAKEPIRTTKKKTTSAKTTT